MWLRDPHPIDEDSKLFASADILSSMASYYPVSQGQTAPSLSRLQGMESDASLQEVD